MAKSCYEYVKSFELKDVLEPMQWITLRLEASPPGEMFEIHRREEFQKLLCDASGIVMKMFKEIHIGYTYDYKVHFLLRRDTTAFRRRGFKILSNISSLLSSALMLSLQDSNSDKEIKIFNGSIYMLPNTRALQDYFMAQQLKCHQNNLRQTALKHLIGTGECGGRYILENSTEGMLNEMLFSRFGVNYNNEPVHMKKGVCLINNASLELLTTDFNAEFWSRFPSYSTTESTKEWKYIEKLRRPMPITPHSWVVVRIDGRCFHRFTELHGFSKPNDNRGLSLMSSAAKVVMHAQSNLIIGYGVSDEFSFVVNRYGHGEKDAYSLASRIVSHFTAAYVDLWKTEFPAVPLTQCPSFDARVIIYPTVSNLRDYLSWRQADCHINNLYNTCFWNLVSKGGLSPKQAQERLSGTVSSEKRDILESEFGMDYDQEPTLYRKGTVLYSFSGEKDRKVFSSHCDIIGDSFWEERPSLLGEEKKAKSSKSPEAEGL